MCVSCLNMEDVVRTVGGWFPSLSVPFASKPLLRNFWFRSWVQMTPSTWSSFVNPFSKHWLASYNRHGQHRAAKWALTKPTISGQLKHLIHRSSQHFTFCINDENAFVSTSDKSEGKKMHIPDRYQVHQFLPRHRKFLAPSPINASWKEGVWKESRICPPS